MTLQSFEVTFEYIPGKKNTAADALSRNIDSDTEENCTTVCSIVELTTLDETQVSTEQRKDDKWRNIIRYLGNSN